MSEQVCPKCGADADGPGSFRCGTVILSDGSIDQRWGVCVTAERDQYKQKADTLDMLLELMQSFEGVSTADLSRTDAYIAAWQKLKSERDQLQQRVAELEGKYHNANNLLKALHQGILIDRDTTIKSMLINADGIIAQEPLPQAKDGE